MRILLSYFRRQILRRRLQRLGRDLAKLRRAYGLDR